jgi:hypothetical protein
MFDNNIHQERNIHVRVDAVAALLDMMYLPFNIWSMFILTVDIDRNDVGQFFLDLFELAIHEGSLTSKTSTRLYMVNILNSISELSHSI